MPVLHFCFFFFQAEDGIRDSSVTGVQTCALPIYLAGGFGGSAISAVDIALWDIAGKAAEIGRAACRGRGEISVGGGSIKKKKKTGTKRQGGWKVGVCTAYGEVWDHCR